jgi:hypothetical protein
LLDGNRNNSLNDSKRAELEAYIQLDNLVSRLKARAQFKLFGKSRTKAIPEN